LTLVVAAVAILAVSGGIAYRLGSRVEPATPPGMVAADLLGTLRPEFSLPDVEGTPHSIGEWNGKVVVLNFWATWCPPCRKEIPEFVALQQRYGGRGLQFVGIALQRPEDVRSFMAEYGMNYPVLAGEMEVIHLAERYGNRIGALPYTVIIDRGGRIAFLKPGPLPGPEAERVIQPLL
jgi:peroxiredoxin